MSQDIETYTNKILAELSEEITFSYEVSTDVMVFSEKYKKVYNRKNRITHFLRDSKRRYALSANTVVHLEELKRVTEYGDMTHQVQVQWPDKLGQYEWCEVVFRHVVDDMGNVKAVGIWRNIDRQKREQVMLQHQVVSTSMEGVQNRIGIEQQINQELTQMEDSEKAALFFVDFDDMKQIQSSIGVLAMEELMQLYAKELLVHFHEDGIVGHLGGDRFLVFIRRIKDKDMVKMLAKRMQHLLQGVTGKLKFDQVITVCIGIAMTGKGGSYKEVLEEADIALRHGKNAGKNQYVLYSHTMQGEKYIKKIQLPIGKQEKDKSKSTKSTYDAGKIWPDLLARLYKRNKGEKRALEDALAFIGNIFHLDKVMVWEFTTDRELLNNTMQWTREGLPNTMAEQQGIVFTEEDYKYTHDTNGIFYCMGPEKMPAKMREYANRERFQSILEARIDGDEGGCLGFIDFGLCTSGRVWVQEEIDLLILMSQVLGERLRKRHMSSKMENYYDNTRNILDNVVTGIYVMDQETREVYYQNNAMNHVFPEHMTEEDCKKCNLEKNGDCKKCLLEAIIGQTEQGNGMDGIVIHNPRSNKEYEFKATKMRWENRKNAYIITANEHVASPEERERQRRQEFLEKRYAFIYSHSCDCIFDIDVENDWYEVTVISEDGMWDGLALHGRYSEMLRDTVEMRVVAEDRPRLNKKFSLESLRQSVQNGDNMILDSFVVYSRTNTLHSKEVHAFILEENGRKSVVATYCDVTEQRRKEMQELLERQKLNRAVVSVYPVVVSINVTQNQFAIMANETSSGFLDGKETIFSNAVLDLAMHMHPEDRDHFIATFERENLRKIFSNGKSDISLELRISMEDGGYQWFSLVCICIDNPLNEDLLLYVFARNIDQRKAMEQNLKDALTTAERASEAKSDFLSRMSHEIRTPMNAIIGMTELAQGKEMEPETISKYLKKIDVSAKYLLTLINNILDMSRIESNKVVIEKKELRIQDILDNIHNIIAPQAKEKGIHFSIEKKNSFDCVYMGDILRINQILLNLLSNAIKFTASGGAVSLTVKENRRENKESYLCFIVADTGEGMSEDFMKNMYQPFEQEDANSPQGMKGTGLGLSITKNLITLMDGHIKCKSHKGEGTTFIVELKMDVVDKSEGLWIMEPITMKNVEEKLNLLVGKRILLAEDNPLNQEIAVAMLEMQHIVVDCVENGELAVQKFLEMGSFHYDMILMDIRMPVKNGLDATADIRAIRGKYAEEIPILAMSANAFAEDKAKAFANGMTDYIVKPIDSDILKEMLVKYLV